MKRLIATIALAAGVLAVLLPGAVTAARATPGAVTAAQATPTSSNNRAKPFARPRSTCA